VSNFNPFDGTIRLPFTFEEFEQACPELAKHMQRHEPQRAFPAPRPWTPIEPDLGVYDVIGRAEEVSALEDET